MSTISEPSSCLGIRTWSRRSSVESLPFPPEEAQPKLQRVYSSSALTSTALSRRDFIRKHYNISFYGKEVSSLHSVREFILCEEPLSPGHSEMNARLINYYARKNDIVLVEDVPRQVVLHPIHPNDALQSVWLATEARIAGWDFGSVRGRTGYEICEKACEVERKIQILKRKLLDFESEENSVEIRKEIMAAQKEKKAISKEMASLKKTMDILYSQTFPLRVKSNMDSLDQAKEAGAKHTYLIANLDFIPGTQRQQPELTDYCKFLKKRNVVVLIPKPEKVEELKAEREALLRE